MINGFHQLSKIMLALTYWSPIYVTLIHPSIFQLSLPKPRLHQTGHQSLCPWHYANQCWYDRLKYFFQTLNHVPNTNSEIWSSKRDDISLIILKPLVVYTRSKSYCSIQNQTFLITNLNVKVSKYKIQLIKPKVSEIQHTIF